MITLAQHIANEYDGNVSAFAKDVSKTRQTAARLVKDGALWINGRAYDAVTAEEEGAVETWVCHECYLAAPMDVNACPECGYARQPGAQIAGALKLLADMPSDEVRTITISYNGTPELIFEITAAQAASITEVMNNEN